MMPFGPQIFGNGKGGYHGLAPMIRSLRSFLELTGAQTIPSLDELETLPDKVPSPPSVLLLL
jgi:hypothetical protein